MATGKKNETEKLIVKADKGKSRINPNPVDLNWDGSVEDIYATLKAAYDNKEKNTRWIQITIPGQKDSVGVSAFLNDKEYKTHKNAGKVKQEWLDMIENKENAADPSDKKNKTNKSRSLKKIIDKLISKTFWKEAATILKDSDIIVIEGHIGFAGRLIKSLSEIKKLEEKIKQLESAISTFVEENLPVDKSAQNQINKLKKELEELESQCRQDSCADG